MNGPQLSPIRKAWYRWKSLKLPWRKRFLVGLDLQGNTYWEFHDAITLGRMRRIVEYPSTVQYSDIKITPQWHQWLRHTRQHPPSLTEQSQDLVRQQQLKVLAARADARWDAKESYLDAPERQQRGPGTEVRDRGGYVGEVDDTGRGVESLIAGVEDVDGLQRREGESEGEGETNRLANGKIEKERRTRVSEVREDKEREDPWKKTRGGPSEEWQPQAWGGGGGSAAPTPRRR